MNWNRFSFSKRFGLLSCLLPGSTFLFVVAVGKPKLLTSFELANFFGYNSKLAILVSLAFIIGLPVQSFIGFLQRRFILNPMIRMIRIGQNLQEARIDNGQPMPWESNLWRSLVRQLIPIGLPEDGPLAEDSDVWKDLWHAIDLLRFTEWGVLQSITARTMALSVSSAIAILLFGSLIVPNLRSWWTLPLELAWLILAWHVPATSLRNRNSFSLREKEQLSYLLRIIVTKTSPSLEVW